MYKLIKKITEIQNVFTAKENCIYVDRSDCFYFNGVKINEYKSLYFYADGYVLKNTETSSFLFLNDELMKELKHDYFGNTFSEEGSFYYENIHYDDKDDKIKKDIYYHDFCKNKEYLVGKSRNESFLFTFFSKKKAISFEPINTLRSFSLLTGNYEWESNLNVKRIIEIIGIYQKTLILTYESMSNQTGIMALSLDTGETVWDKEVGGMYYFYPLFNRNGNTAINLHCGSLWLNGVQVAQGVNVFTEINLTDGSITRKEVLKALDDIGLGIDKFIIEGDNIYFTATYQGSFGAVAIGVLDYNTLNLLWWQQVEMSDADGFGNFLMNKPVVGGNKLYVLDKINVLHIFEREEKA